MKLDPTKQIYYDKLQVSSPKSDNRSFGPPLPACRQPMRASVQVSHTFSITIYVHTFGSRLGTQRPRRSRTECLSDVDNANFRRFPCVILVRLQADDSTLNRTEVLNGERTGDGVVCGSETDAARSSRDYSCNGWTVILCNATGLMLQPHDPLKRGIRL